MPSFPFFMNEGGKSGEYEELRERPYTKLLGNGTLLLQHVKEDREGFYLCQASNGIGSGIGKVIQLKVNCKPLPPPRRDPATIPLNAISLINEELVPRQPRRSLLHPRAW
jgi:hypothetical protein